MGALYTTSYKYNENGLRTEKTVNEMTHEYTYMGSNVTREIIRDGANILYSIYYSYAGGNSPTSMNVNGVNYYFLKNAQGDVTHILDEQGNTIGAYEYDAWGNILSVTGGEIAELNPYRYRGYRYDSETGLYYLQSRYYNPVWGRFINGDVILGDVGLRNSHNIFQYCFNNPVYYSDPDGYFPVDAVRESLPFVVPLVPVLIVLGKGALVIGGVLLLAGGLYLAAKAVSSKVTTSKNARDLRNICVKME